MVSGGTPKVMKIRMQYRAALRWFILVCVCEVYGTEAEG